MAAKRPEGVVSHGAPTSHGVTKGAGARCETTPSVAFGDISPSRGEIGAYISIIDLFTRPMMVIAPSSSGGGISRYDAGWKGGVSLGR
jgi:hypothetical protein